MNFFTLSKRFLFVVMMGSSAIGTTYAMNSEQRELEWALFLSRIDDAAYQLGNAIQEGDRAQMGKHLVYLTGCVNKDTKSYVAQALDSSMEAVMHEELPLETEERYLFLETFAPLFEDKEQYPAIVAAITYYKDQLNQEVAQDDQEADEYQDDYQDEIEASVYNDDLKGISQEQLEDETQREELIDQAVEDNDVDTLVVVARYANDEQRARIESALDYILNQEEDSIEPSSEGSGSGFGRKFLLLAGLGGGAYWLWRNGYINIPDLSLLRQ